MPCASFLLDERSGRDRCSSVVCLVALSLRDGTLAVHLQRWSSGSGGARCGSVGVSAMLSIRRRVALLNRRNLINSGKRSMSTCMQHSSG